MIRAGDLNQRIIIQQATIARDTYGAEIQTWVTYAAVWASKQHKSSREFYSAQKTNAEITELFIIRYRNNITTKMRISYNGRYYDILGADDPDGGREEIWLIAKAVE